MRFRAWALHILIILWMTLFPASYAIVLSAETPSTVATTPTPAPANGTSAADASQQAKKASDAANRVEQAASTAASLIDQAAKYRKSIGDITGATTKLSQSTLDSLQTLQATVLAVQQNNLISALGDTKRLESAKSDGKDACDNLSQPATAQQDVTDALAACKKTQNDASDKLAALGTALTNLQCALASISPYLAGHFDDLATKLKPFSDKNLVAAPGGTPPSGTPDPAAVLQVLPKGLPVLRQLLESEAEYRPAWNGMKPVVQAASKACLPTDSAKSTPPPPDADTELQKLQATVEGIQNGLTGWFAAVSGKLQADAQTLNGKIAGVEADPAKNSADALGDVRDKTDTLATAQSVVDAWPPLVGFLVDGQPSGFSLSTTKKSYEDLQKWTNVLRASISRVHDSLAGDFNNSEADQVSLYYFTDVPRLMQVLNESVQTVGGVAEAKAQADAQRTALTQAELDLADAQAAVNRYQKQVLDLQEQQRQANEKLKGLNGNASRLASKLKHAQDDKEAANIEYQSAADKQNAESTKSGTNTVDPTIATTVDKAKAKQTAKAAKLSDAQSNYDAAKTERDNAQTKADEAQNQKDSLPSKLAEAQQALSDAQTSVAQQRRKMIMTAQVESDAFAFARDNAPFMYAAADASSPNPAKRVMLYAFNDSKTIFMRGNPKDLALVKHIISVFDTPAPQARLTLWTFELDADSAGKTNEKAAKSLNKSMEIIDEELSQTRALENTTLSLLRDVINQEARTCFKKALISEPTEEEEKEAKQAKDRETLERQRIEDMFQKPDSLQYTTPEDFKYKESERKHVMVYAKAQCAPPPVKKEDCPRCTDAEFEKLRRITFYDPLVLVQLGLKDDGHLDLVKLRELVPDPAGTTTLGEALMILSLAPLSTRLAVRNDFERAVQERLRKLPLSKDLNRCAWFRPDQNSPDRDYDKRCADHPSAGEKEPCTNGECLLQLTWHGLGIWEQGVTNSGRALTSSQLEITRALKTAYTGKQIRKLLGKLETLYEGVGATPVSGTLSPDAGGIRARLSTLVAEQNRLAHLGKAKLPSVDAKRLDSLQSLGRSASESEKAEEQRLLAKAIRQLSVQEQGEYSLNQDATLALKARLETISIKSISILKQLEDLGVDASELATRLGAATTQDEIKKILLDLKIVAYQSPTLSSASPRVAAADQMLKEIIIALEDDLDRLFVQPMITNLRVRLMAAKVRVGVLQRESLLASNRGKARVDPKASAQLAVGEEQDILSGVQQLAQLYATVQSGGALAAFGALQQQPREQQPEIYALTTGNKFEVTPIFDPSGQALRFKFDFVSTTNLQEPNGTTNPQFPRIERHTVNTEVQLSNLETREISRFESDARLGLPTTYWGGLPILKDIPYVRPWIPLVGWFVRKAGSNASAQQSVIFGQTTMYPTIGTIIDLLADPTVSAGDTTTGDKTK